MNYTDEQMRQRADYLLGASNSTISRRDGEMFDCLLRKAQAIRADQIRKDAEICGGRAKQKDEGFKISKHTDFFVEANEARNCEKEILAQLPEATKDTPPGNGGQVEAGKERAYEERCREGVPTDLVLIWSRMHRSWWKQNSCGYTTNRAEAGVFQRDDAISRTKHIGSENPIELQDVAQPSQPRPELSDIEHPMQHAQPDEPQPRSTEELHDDYCERIEVDIGVGTQVSPCHCHERSLETRLRELQDEIADSHDTIRKADEVIAALKAERTQARLAALAAGYQGGNLGEIIDEMRRELALLKAAVRDAVKAHETEGLGPFLVALVDWKREHAAAIKLSNEGGGKI